MKIEDCRAIVQTMNLLHLFGIGIVAGLLSTWGAIKLFPYLKLLDFPERYGLHRKRIPYPGGLVIGILTLITCFVFRWIGVGIAVFITLTFSFLDDRKPLPAIIRLIVQIAMATMVVLLFGITIQQIGNPFGKGIFVFTPFGAGVLTVLWLLLVQNALNWFDGLKGLCTGVSGIGFLILGLFGLIRPEVAWETDLPVFLQISFALAGICLGSWILFFRGKILLGDSGSQVLGLMLGILSIVAGTKLATTLLLLGIPLLDAIVVILRRIFRDKKSPLRGDQKHIHHTLAKKIGEPPAVLILLLLSTLLGVASLFLPGWGKLGIATLVGFTLLVLHFRGSNPVHYN